MDNPERSYQTLDPLVMYKYDNHTNLPWNITEYHTPRLEVNPDLEVQKRKWESQKKGVPSNKYETKKGFYMDYDLKVAKGIPSTFDHGENKEWNFEQIRKKNEKNKVDPKLSKYTYLDRIEMEQKNRKSPGVCAYSLEKSQKEKQADLEKLKKKKVHQDERTFFYMDTEKMSDSVPGPGNFCPNLPSPRIRPNKTTYKFWVDKHKKEGDATSKRDSLKPAPGTHSPMNMTLNTFERLQKDQAKPSKVQHLGLDSRFEYTRPNKKKIVEKRPDPSSYKTSYQWRGKHISPKKQLWDTMIWKGKSTSVYH